jgi:hypothetical protein
MRMAQNCYSIPSKDAREITIRSRRNRQISAEFRFATNPSRDRLSACRGPLHIFRSRPIWASFMTAAANVRAAVSAADGKRYGWITLAFDGQVMITTAGVFSGLDQLDGDRFGLVDIWPDASSVTLDTRWTSGGLGLVIFVPQGRRHNPSHKHGITMPRRTVVALVIGSVQSARAPA